MNKVLLIARLCRDPEIRTGKDNLCVAKFTVACDRRGKDQEADFISCVAFGKTGEFVEKYFKKGMKVALEGRWQTGSYTNKEGQKVYTNDCVIEQCEFAESKKANEQTAPAAPQGDDFMNLPADISDEIPFG